jgi:hypothetical protein
VGWGEEFDPEHLVKSLVAGVVRYQSFLRTLKEQEAPGKRSALGRIIGLDWKRSANELALAARIGASIAADEGEVRSAASWQLEVFLFGVSGNGELELLQSPPARLVIGDAEAAKVLSGGETECIYQVPEALAARDKDLELGAAVRLLCEGKEQDARANPPFLRNQLGRFARLYP